MNDMSTRDSAKIYDFPRRSPNAGLRRRPAEATDRVVPMPRLPTTEFGSAWYHEAAMQEDERTRKP